MDKKIIAGGLLCSLGCLITLYKETATKVTTISQKGIDLIKSFEGCRLTAYQDVAGVWTIGYGHTKNVYQGQTISSTEAENLLKNDLEIFCNSVATNTETVNLTQNQFDALTSFCYNVGTSAFAKSTLLKKVLADKDDTSIANEFMKWVYAGGVVVSGLQKRREKESNLYFS